MKKWTYLFVAVQALACILAPRLAAAQLSIEISTIEELQKIGNDPAYPLGGDYVLTQDIDASDTVNWNGGRGFKPIGGALINDLSTGFKGKLDGQGFRIENLSISMPLDEYVGLFGTVGKGGAVENISLYKASISARNGVGGVAGCTDGGFVTNCFVTGRIEGKVTVGGIVGFSFSNSVISKCVSSVVLKGGNNSGGLIGLLLDSALSDSYATGIVQSGQYDSSAGLVGALKNSVIRRCYSANCYYNYPYNSLCNSCDKTSSVEAVWDKDLCWRVFSLLGPSISSKDMMRSSTYTSAGWDFSTDDGNPPVWKIDEGESYPSLASMEVRKTKYELSIEISGSGNVSVDPPAHSYDLNSLLELTPIPDEGYYFSGWTGLEFGADDNPLTADPLAIIVNRDISIKASFLPCTPISSLEELRKIGNEYPLSGHYFLVCDIDAAETHNNGNNFYPIGNDVEDFTGTFDGNGNTIENLFINSYLRKNVGLFGCVSSNAAIKSLKLKHATMFGMDTAGFLAGYCSGIVDNCIVEDSIIGGGNTIGGLIGYTYFSKISNSSVIGIKVNSASMLGGLVGKCWGGKIEKSSALGTLKCDSLCGGLIGVSRNFGNICESWSNCNIKVDCAAGGLIGAADLCSVNQCFTCGLIKSSRDTGGIIGRANTTFLNDSYSTVFAEGDSCVAGLIGNSSQNFISHCYTVSYIESKEYRGALIGLSDKDEVLSALWDTETTGISKEPLGIPTTIDAMKNKKTFEDTGWNVSTRGEDTFPWSIDEGKGVPYLTFSGNQNRTLNLGETFSDSPLVRIAPEQNQYDLNDVVVIEPSRPDIASFTSLKVFDSEIKTHVTYYNKIPLVMAGNWVIDGIIFRRAYFSDIEQIQQIGKSPDYPLYGYYTLVQDIDASNTETWNGGMGFTPIAVGDNDYFTGVFNGNGFTIKNLNINLPDIDNVGLIRKASSTAVIKNLGLENATIKGHNSVGALVGVLGGGKISNSFATGAVLGNYWVGGLCGELGEPSTLTDSCFIGFISGNYYVGGLCGYSRHCKIDRSYSVPYIFANKFFGGLQGIQTASIMNGCFWDTSLQGLIQSAGGMGHSTANMMKILTYTTQKWDISNEISDGTTWTIRENESYPYFPWAVAPDAAFTLTAPTYGHGTVSASPEQPTYTPYSLVWLTAAPADGYWFDGWYGPGVADELSPIRETPLPVVMTSDKTVYPRFRRVIPLHNAAGLRVIGKQAAYPLDGHYTLTEDIDAANSAHWNGGLGHDPIGTSDTPFTGDFDGGGHVIRNLTVARPAQHHAGLFGVFTGTVRNLGIANASVSGRENAGGLAGCLRNALVEHCYVQGAVSADIYAGGLAGSLENATLRNTYAAAAVYASLGEAGGLAGDCHASRMTASFATGDVACPAGGAGGLAGSLRQCDVTQCYATGAVSAGMYAGGLAEVAIGATVDECYAAGPLDAAMIGGLLALAGETTLTASFWDTNTTGDTESLWGAGLPTAGMLSSETFMNAGWDFDTVWAIDEGVSYPYLHWAADSGFDPLFDSPDGNPVGGARIHSTDRNGNGTIELSELLEALQFFNAGGFGCGEDGNYTAGSDAPQDCPRYTADFQAPCWRLDLSEALRLVQLYIARGYTAAEDAASDDGFRPITKTDIAGQSSNK